MSGLVIVLVSRRRADKFAVRARELRAVDYQSSLGFGAVLNPRSGTFGAMPSSVGFGQPSKFGAASPPITNGMRGVYSIPPPTPHIGLRFRLLFLPSILFLRSLLQPSPPTVTSQVTSIRNVHHPFCSDFANPLSTSAHPGLTGPLNSSPPPTRMERLGEQVR